MGGLDQTVMVAVLPQVVADLHVPLTRLDHAAWIVTAYLLAYTAAMPLVGRAADVRGYRPLFMLSALVFATGSLVVAVAGNLWLLVAARAVQAVGAGGMVPIAIAAAAAAASGRMRLLWIGAMVGAAEAGAVLGPLYGAVMLRELGWRSVFWVNLPLAAILVVLVALLLREWRGRNGAIDYLGALLIGASLLVLTLGVSGENVAPGHYRPLLLGGAGVLAAAFVWRQRRARSPLIAPALLARRSLVSASGMNVVVGGALVVALVEVPLFATTVLGKSPTEGAFTLLRLTAAIPVGAVAGGWLGAWLPFRLVVAGGMLTSGAAFLRMSRWHEATGDTALTVDLAFCGLGFGVVLAPLAGSALTGAGFGNEAIGATAVTIARTLGMTVALASLAAWGVAEFDARMATLELPIPEAGPEEDYLERVERYEAEVRAAALFVFNRLFLVAAFLCALAAPLAAWLRAPPAGIDDVAAESRLGRGRQEHEEQRAG